MGSNVKKDDLFMVLLMFAAIIGIVVYDNRDSLKKTQETSAEADMDKQVVQATADGQGGQIGDDPRAFLSDETFFDADKKPYSSIEKIDGNHLSLLMTSVEKDLRVQIVDNAGKLVTGENFCIVLNKKDEYTDEDQDGVIYIEHLRSGDYAVALKEITGYQVPSTEATITVKQSVEYVAIEDINLLILTEKDINPELEDIEVNGAQDDADDSEITKIQEGNATAKFGIDVSKWNKEIDWDKVKKAGVEYAIIRLGYRGATTGALVEDPYFEKNMKGAAAAGIPVGVYFFTQAVNEVEAVEEASMVIQMCRDYEIDYPVFIDSESTGGNGRADGLEMEMRTNVCEAFCETIESAGYRAGVYASRNWYNEMLDVDRLDDFVIWLAEYRDVPLYQGYYHMWQYTSSGSVDGIEGRVDFNLSYLKIEEDEEEPGIQIKIEDDDSIEDESDSDEDVTDSDEEEEAAERSEADDENDADNKKADAREENADDDDRDAEHENDAQNDDDDTDREEDATNTAGGRADNER